MTAQVVTITEPTTGRVQLLSWDWLCTDGGAVSSTTTRSFNGEVLKVAFVPDSGGTAPTDLYDATITDANSVDILAGQGANLSNASTVVITEDLLPVAGNRLTLTIANAGDANGGVVHVWLKEA